MITSQAEQIVARLRGRWHGHYGMARCPAHDDHTPSLSIAQGRIGPLFKCHAGCTFLDIMRALRRCDINVRVHSDIGHPTAQRAYSLSLIERLWAHAGPLAGTLGQRYLVARGLGHEHGCLRFAPRCSYGPVRAPIRVGPALLVPLHHQHRLVGLQRLFLEPACPPSAPLAQIGG